jgi:benzoyl-CoA-dihydrodiol lyase
MHYDAFHRIRRSTHHLAAPEGARREHQPPRVEYQTHPSQYHHWKLSFDGAIATLAMDVDADAGLRDGYKLKLNSYDLGVDIELNDARQPHPLRTPRGAHGDRHQRQGQGLLLGRQHLHAGCQQPCVEGQLLQVHQRDAQRLEDSSTHSGLKFLAAVNGACAGGGYELALACDEIILVDDRSSAVSLPEVPLLGVLPGTGGLTRVTDKRHVRHDLADIFCTTNEGVRGQKAKDWRLVDDIVKPAQFAARVQERALQLAAGSDRPADGKGVTLNPLQRTLEADALHYRHVSVTMDRARRCATFTVKAPTGAQPADIAGIEAAGDAWYPLAMARELDDAILSMRTNELDSACGWSRPKATRPPCWRWTPRCRQHQGHWLVRETIGPAAPHLQPPGREQPQPVRADRARLVLRGQLPGTGAGLRPQLPCWRCPTTPRRRRRSPWATPTSACTRWPPARAAWAAASTTRQPALEAVRAKAGQALDADAAFAVGLVTSNPDDIDWADETRIAIEERVAMSPDALTGWKPTCASTAPRTCSRASSAA